MEFFLIRKELPALVGFGNYALGQWGSVVAFIALALILVRKSFFAKLERR